MLRVGESFAPWVVACGVLLNASGARAEAEDRPAASEAPARTGFQMAIESGLSLPFGDARGAPNDDLARRYSYQIPFNVELGGKPTEALYIGSYLGFALGAEGDDPTIEQYCEDDDDDGENDVACNSVSIILGVEARYGFAPSANWNPWIGYGIGFEATNQSIRDHEHGYSESTMSSGITYARLSGGVDYRRISPGLGPALHLALGRFESVRTDMDEELAYRDTIADPGWHLWATLGLRLVIRP